MAATASAPIGVVAAWSRYPVTRRAYAVRQGGPKWSARDGRRQQAAAGKRSEAGRPPLLAARKACQREGRPARPASLRSIGSPTNLWFGGDYLKVYFFAVSETKLYLILARPT